MYKRFKDGPNYCDNQGIIFTIIYLMYLYIFVELFSLIKHKYEI